MGADWHPRERRFYSRCGKHHCLIWVNSCENMVSHIMKTTIEIADDLFERAQEFARREKTTFRALTEQGLRLLLNEKQGRPKRLPPLVTVRGRGLTDEFKTAP